MALLSFNTLSAQNAGCVIDGKTKEPMPFVNVSYHTKGRLNGTTTDANGNYVLGLLSQIDDSVVFQCVGYTTVVKHKSELKGSDIIVTMQQKSFELNEFTVTARRERYRRKNEFSQLQKNISARDDRINPQHASNLRAVSAEENLIAFLVNNPDKLVYIHEKLRPEDFTTDFLCF